MENRLNMVCQAVFRGGSVHELCCGSCKSPRARGYDYAKDRHYILDLSENGGLYCRAKGGFKCRKR